MLEDLGDDLYALPTGSLKSKTKNSKPPRPPRLCLHAARLGFKHPTTGKWLNISTPLPPDLAAFARKLTLIK